jgi:tripartite ATP-independent transporter DctP family solute receptor
MAPGYALRHLNAHKPGVKFAGLAIKASAASGAALKGDVMGRCSIVNRVLPVLVATLVIAGSARADDVRHFSFAYDQPHTTAYGIAGDTFAAKLSELSHGTMLIDQFPGAQLGQEPQVLQKLRTGDVDFSITSTANSATLQPEAGVFSIHFVFRSEDHLVKALADPGVAGAFKEMVNAKVEGARTLALATMGFRNIYGKKDVHNVGDVDNVKIRVQATVTEDTMFPAYGAQTVHMPFGDVYTALQTGIVAMAENGINVFQSNKHYEVAPIMSLTQHEANNNVIWVSDKVWNSLSDEQKKSVQAAADEVAKVEPPAALGLENDSMTKLEKMGVKFIKDVDKSGFIKDAEPLQDKLAAQLGPGAVKVLQLVRGVK